MSVVGSRTDLYRRSKTPTSWTSGIRLLVMKHEHDHQQNRFAVLPTPLRLNADPNRTGRGVTIAFLDPGFYPHADLTEPVNRIIAYKRCQPAAGYAESILPRRFAR